MKNITFENDCIDNRIHWQDVLLNGKCIGAMAQKKQSLFQPAKVWFQKIVPESHKDIVPNWYESEDKGYIFATFPTLEKLINYCHETDTQKTLIFLL